MNPDFTFIAITLALGGLCLVLGIAVFLTRSRGGIDRDTIERK